MLIYTAVSCFDRLQNAAAFDVGGEEEEEEAAIRIYIEVHSTLALSFLTPAIGDFAYTLRRRHH